MVYCMLRCWSREIFSSLDSAHVNRRLSHVMLVGSPYNRLLLIDTHGSLHSEYFRLHRDTDVRVPVTPSYNTSHRKEIAVLAVQSKHLCTLGRGLTLCELSM